MARLRGYSAVFVLPFVAPRANEAAPFLTPHASIDRSVFRLRLNMLSLAIRGMVLTVFEDVAQLCVTFGLPEGV